ncbi:MAG TPA: nucleotide pyrophosphohydrolase [Thermococcus litoralis]|uniref:Nucleotide pyrophosphohydrolase n=1 Tax=Thermococcus litoralis TaxID=2265 RepID=A0A7C5P2R1_THELI|nr:nucleotide pyrophosphohydrolase [Thermococcus litoralis]
MGVNIMTELNELIERILKFRDERDWKKYHTPKNLIISLLIELGELSEHFQWKTDEEIIQSIQEDKTKEKIAEELADVAIYLLLLANELGINLEEAILEKIKKNEEKYPVDKVKGRYVKYTELMKQ